jgi:ferrous iron transport protein B
MKVVLVGQPNCGKSTLFNHLAGYKAITSNFPGTTVKFHRGRVRLADKEIELIDLPGTYSLGYSDLAEREARRFLLTQDYDVIVNILDASLLGRGLELTLELLELQKPLVLVLNMMDEAERKGIMIDEKKLSQILGIPVVKTIAYKGQGLTEVIQAVIKAKTENLKGNPLPFSRDVEEVINEVTEALKRKGNTANIPLRFLAIKLLERDEDLLKLVGDNLEEYEKKLETRHGRSSDLVIASERHALAMNISEKVSQVLTVPKPSRWDKMDNWLLHPIFGYVFLVLIFLGVFILVFEVGKFLEEPLMETFDKGEELFSKSFSEGPLKSLLQGAYQGFASGIGIVLPYLFPFLIILSLLEDSGYLPRVAFLVDFLLHKMGLHGKSALPFLLGYGCTVPAVMSTRILESERDRILTAILVTLFPCSARMIVISGLVAYFLGPLYALSIYFINLLVIALSGVFLSKLYPEITPGLILEVPPYHIPSLRITLIKTWFRLKEFIKIAWPLLIMGSAVLAFLQHLGLEPFLNKLFLFITHPLGLPRELGVTLLLGILRKELALLMTFQALGTKNVLEVMSPSQIMTFVLFVTFYVPCLATLAALWREIGWRWTLKGVAFSFSIAFLIGLLARLVL